MHSDFHHTCIDQHYFIRVFSHRPAISVLAKARVSHWVAFSMASSPPQLLKRQHEEEENDRKTRQRRDSLSPEPTKHPTFMPFPDLLNPNARQRQIPFQLPSQLLTFSYTPEHVQVFDNSALRYYVDPPVGANLSYGYERWIRRPDERGRLDALLKAVVKIKEDTSKAGAALPHIGVVAWRGIITKYDVLLLFSLIYI